MFKERTWNNPVVRFIRSDKSDIIPKIVHNRQTKSLSTKNLVKKMVEALEASKTPVPQFLSLLNNDLNGQVPSGELSELSKSVYKHIPLGKSQSYAVEDALKKKESPEKFLSPTQLEILKAVKSDSGKEWPVVQGKDLVEAFNELMKVYKKEETK